MNQDAILGYLAGLGAVGMYYLVKWIVNNHVA